MTAKTGFDPFTQPRDEITPLSELALGRRRIVPVPER